MATIIVKNKRVAKYLERKGFPIIEVLDKPRADKANWKEYVFEDSAIIRERIAVLTSK